MNQNYLNQMKRPYIKLCGFTRQIDFSAAVALGIDYVGLVFYEASPRYITPIHAAALIASLPSTTRITPVGLFVNHSAQAVRDVVQITGVKVLQFHGNESAYFCENLSQQLGLPYWKAIHVAPDTDSKALLKLCMVYSNAQALLFDTASLAWGGTGQTFEWHTLAPLIDLKNVPPLILSGGLSSQNVADGIKLVKPWAVDVSSGIEAADTDGKALKGLKDPAKMAAFVSAVNN